MHQPKTVTLYHRDTGEPAVWNVEDGEQAAALGYFINYGPDGLKPKGKKDKPNGADRRPDTLPVRSA